MSNGYVGEIRMVGFNFTPVNWLACDGSLYSIADYDTLYALIGTTYGGNGQTTFGVPDLRSRVLVHQGNDAFGNAYSLGARVGAESVALNTNQLGPHIHTLMGSTSAATSVSPTGGFPALGALSLYTTDAATGNLVSLATNSIAAAGSSLPHSNIMPYLCINFIISPYGIYPSQT